MSFKANAGFPPASTFTRPFQASRAYRALTLSKSKSEKAKRMKPPFWVMSVIPAFDASPRRSATCTRLRTLGGSSPKRSLSSSMISSASSDLRIRAMRR